MKKRCALLVLFLILLSAIAQAECQKPINGKSYTADKIFCGDTFYIPEGITIGKDNITIDCNHAVLRGNDFEKAGITIQNKKNIVIKNCKIANYANGLYIHNSTNIAFYDNTLMRNSVGIRLSRSEHNILEKNMDISLERPVKAIESKNNRISFTNKKLEEDYCRQNACNTKDGTRQIEKISEEKESLLKTLKLAIKEWITIS